MIAKPVTWESLQVGMKDAPSDSVRTRIDGIIDGRIVSHPSPWDTITRGTLPLLPGTVTVIVGDPGSGKSLLTLQWAGYLIGRGLEVGVLELECDREYHLTRYLVQLSGETGLIDPDWVKANAARSQRLHEEHAESLNRVGETMRDSPSRAVTYQHVLTWMKRESEWCKVFMVDPITACEQHDKPWIADREFLTEARKILKAGGATLVVVTHPKKGKNPAPSFDDLAGGAAWARFTDCVLWLQHLKEPEVVNVYSPDHGHTVERECNRKMIVCKARNGPAHGGKIAMHFDPKSLTFSEIGAVIG